MLNRDKLFLVIYRIISYRGHSGCHLSTSANIYKCQMSPLLTFYLLYRVLEVESKDVFYVNSSWRSETSTRKPLKKIW